MDMIKLAKDLKGEVGAVTGVDQPVREFVSTGNYALDYSISGKILGGGLPVGRVVELFGDPSTGKSVLILNALAATQKMGGIVIYDDPEQSYDQFFARKLGVVPEEFFMLDSETVEEHFQKIEKVVRKIRELDEEILITIALDSLAMLSTRHEKETGFEKVDMFKAKLIRQGMRMLGGWFSKQRVLYICSNHVIANIGSMYGPKSTTPGGGGVPFQASVRVEMTRGGILATKENKDDKVGVHVRAQVVKNKIAPPFRKCAFDIMFATGVNPWSGLFDVLVTKGIIVSAGGWFTFDGTKYRQDDLNNPAKLEEIVNVLVAKGEL